MTLYIYDSAGNKVAATDSQKTAARADLGAASSTDLDAVANTANSAGSAAASAQSAASAAQSAATAAGSAAAAAQATAAAAYVKPANGIPHNDLHQGIRDQLGLAESALQPGALPAGTTVTAAQINDASAAGRAVLTAADGAAQRTALGLGNVNNTSDANKPVSTAQALAIGAKMDATLPALQVVVDSGTPAQKAAFSASVSGAGVVYDSQSAATQNRVQLQAALNAGGVSISGKAGQMIYIDAHLSVPDDSHFYCDGPAVAVADGIDDYAIGNAAMDAPWTTVSVSWTSGRTATVTGLSGLEYGDAICLQGDGTTAQQWFEVMRVGAVTGSSAVVFLPFTPTAAPAGVLRAKRLTNNARVRARVRHSGVAGGQSVKRMGAVFAFAANARVEILNPDNTPKYGLLTCATLDSEFICRSDRETNSDTLKVYGPTRGSSFYASGGSSHEDCVSVQPEEPPAFIAYQPAIGSADAVVRMHGSTGTGSGPIVLYTSNRFDTSAVLENPVATSTGAAPALAIKLGDTQTAPTSRLSRGVTVRGGHLQAGTGSCVAVSGYWADSLVFDGTRLTAPGAATYRTVSVASNCSIGTLVFRGVDFDFGAWPSTTDQPISIDGVVDEIVFEDCTITSGGAMRMITCNSGSQVRAITFRNTRNLTAMDQLVEIQAGAIACRITFESGVYVVSALTKCKATSCVVTVRPGVTVSGATGGVLRLDTASTVGTLIDEGASLIAASVPLGLANSAEAIIRAPYTGIALNTAGLRRTAGSQAIASAAAGTIPAGHPVIADGASWRSRIDPTLIFT